MPQNFLSKHGESYIYIDDSLKSMIFKESAEVRRRGGPRRLSDTGSLSRL